MVMYEDEKLLGKNLDEKNGETQVYFLEKPYGIAESQLQLQVFNSEVVPKIFFFFNRKLLWQYLGKLKFCFNISRLQTVPNTDLHILCAWLQLCM